MPQSAAVRVAHEDDLPLLRQEGNPRSHDFNSATLDVRTLLDVWLRWRRCWIGSGVWPVRPRLTSNVITPRSSADLKRPPLVVVLHSPFVAADYAAQISHGSPSSTSVWIGADVTRLWPYPRCARTRPQNFFPPDEQHGCR
jgi:hypothetical protein